MATMNIHGVKNIEVKETERLTLGNGDKYVRRYLTITDENGATFGITLFGDVPADLMLDFKD